MLFDDALDRDMLALALDEIDHGVVILEAQRLVFMNHAARAIARWDLSPLRVAGDRLEAATAADTRRLNEVLDHCARRGLRRLLRLGEAPNELYAAVVSLRPGDQGARLCLTLGRAELVPELSAFSFGNLHGLTPTECRVLAMLSDGLDPIEIARSQRVSEATVRTHLINIRAKTCQDSLRSLTRRLALLPPMMKALRGQAEA